MVEDVMPYGKAIYEVAKEAKKEVEYMEVLKELSDIWTDEKEFVLALGHPKIARATKKQWLMELFSSKLNETMMQMLMVFNQHDVVDKIPSIYQAYVQSYQEAHDIEIVNVESASALDETQIASLKKKLEQKLDKTVDMHIKVVPELIAGLKVQTKDIVLDNTVLSKLKTMKEKLSN